MIFGRLIRLVLFAALSGSTLLAAEEAAPQPPGDKFSNESEAGVVLSSGNAEIRAFNLKQTNAYEFTGNLFRFEGRYIGSSNAGKETARFLTLGLRYERLLVDRLSLFAGETFQTDIFAGYDPRYNTDLGVKYLLVRGEEIAWAVEAGYRYINERLTSGAHNDRSNARFYTETVYHLHENLSLKLWLEYIQSLQNEKDSLLNGELSVSALINQIFSVKLSYLVRYNANPQPGLKTTDGTFTAALVAKF